MFKDLHKDATLWRILLVLAIIAVGSYVGSLLWQFITLFSDIFIILGVAWLVSFILEPIVDYCNVTLRLPKLLATAIAYIFTTALLAAAIFLFIPVIVTQIEALTKIIPAFLSSYPQFLTRFGDMIAQSLNNSISLIPSVAQFLFSVVIVLILSFYFNFDRDTINNEIFSLTPKKWHGEIRFFQQVVTGVFASFLRVQLVFGLSSGIATWLVLRIFNIDYAASISFLSGVFAFIPLIGPLLAIIPPVFVTFISDPTKAIFVFVILLALQQIIFNVVGPRLLGQAFKVHPVIIFLSFLVGVKIAGGIGAVFIIPVIGIAAVIIRQVGHQFLKSRSN